MLSGVFGIKKVKAKQWCPLCLIVQVVLWSIFIFNILFGFIRIPEFDIIFFKNLLLVGSVYAISILSLRGISEIMSEKELKNVMGGSGIVEGAGCAMGVDMNGMDICDPYLCGSIYGGNSAGCVYNGPFCVCAVRS